MNNTSAKLTILKYLLDHPYQVVRYRTLQQISEEENPRPLIQRLQRQEGWHISWGRTILDMIDAGEIPTDDPQFPDIASIEPDDVILLDTTPDPDAPRRWRMAERIRNQ